MADKLVVLGAGYTGRELVEQALGRGLNVVATSRSDEVLGELREMGAQPIKWDIQTDGTRPIEPHLEPAAAVVYSIPTLYREYEAADDPTLVARHLEPPLAVLQACGTDGVERFVYLSSTSVYGNHDGAWVDEHSDPKPASPYGCMRREIEEYVLRFGREYPTNVARLCGIYGPGRTIVDYIEKGRYKLVAGGEKPTNRIHVEDIAQSVLAMIDRAPGGSRVYNVCDGNPRTVRELVDFLVEHLDLERPEEITLEEYANRRGPNVAARWKNMYRCDNSRLVDELGVELRYPDAIAGYKAIFDL